MYFELYFVLYTPLGSLSRRIDKTEFLWYNNCISYKKGGVFMGNNYEKIDLKDIAEGAEEVDEKEKDTELEKKLNNEITDENKRIATTAFSVIAVCSTIIAGTIVATVSLL